MADLIDNNISGREVNRDILVTWSERTGSNGEIEFGDQLCGVRI